MADNLRKFTTQEVLNKVYSDSSGNSIGINAATSKETLNAALDTANSRLNVSLAGGTISGDVTITGDLTVNGGGSLSFDEIIQGTQVIDVTSTEALLVRKNDDGGDVFVVDTTNSNVGIGVTPETSHSSVTTLQVGGLAALLATSAQAGASKTWLANNTYVNSSGSFAYIVTDEASLYQQNGGKHSFSTVASGSADSAITFTKNMIIDINSKISLSNNDNGTSNTVFGKNAGLDLISGGNNNNFFGELAGTNVTTGDENIAIGKESLQSAQTAVANISIGNQSLQDLTFNGASYNTAVGYQSGYDLISGIKNVFVGAFTGYATTDVDNTVIIGYNAGAANMTSTADGTVAVGTFALDSLTSGTRNMAIGYNAGTGIQTGGDNTLVGWGAGDGLSDAANSNTIIGANAEGSSAGATNQIVIGAGAEGQGSNTIVLGKASASAVYAARNASASVEASAFNVGSDRKLKKNIRDTALQGIDLIDQMQVRDFEWKDNDVTVNGGLIAQELKEIYPDAVGKRNDDGEDGDTTMTISRESMVPLLIKAVQELSEKVKELESK